jgi:hypothetical protein
MKALPDGSHDDLPVDPEYDDTSIGASREGIRTVAKLLGAFRRELRAEGFTKKETYSLSEEWLKGTFGKIDNEEDEDE